MHVIRTRLSLALRRQTSGGVGLIVAPAGFGKTELIDETFPDAHKVDATTALDMIGLARAIIVAAVPGAAVSLTELLLPTPTTPDTLETLVAWLACELAGITEPIVIDDFHRLRNDDVLRDFVVALIERTTPQTRWIICSRESPDLQLGKSFAQVSMTAAIGPSDLAFTFEECRRIADHFNPTIGQDDLATIVDDSEGWPIVVRLQLEAWRDSKIGKPPVHARNPRAVINFFESEILLRRNERERELLYAVALAGSISPVVLEAAGFDQVHALLESLQSTTLMRLDSTVGYLLPRVLSDSILEPLIDRTSRKNLLIRLARAFEHYGQWIEALNIAGLGRDSELIVDLLAKHGIALIDTGNQAIVDSALHTLRWSERKKPVPAALFAYLQVVHGDAEVAEAELRAVPKDELPPAIARALAFSHAWLASKRADPSKTLADVLPYIDCEDVNDRVRAIYQAAAALSELDRAQESQEMLVLGSDLIDFGRVESRAVLFAHRAVAKFYLGEYTNAERDARKAVEFGRRYEDHRALLMAYATLTSVAQWIYLDWSVANEYSEQWLVEARRHGSRLELWHALASAANIAAERGDDDRFVPIVAELRRLRINPNAILDVGLRWSSALHEVGRGRAREAVFLMTCALRDERYGVDELARSLTGLLWAIAGEDESAASVLLKRSDSPNSAGYSAYLSIVAAAYRSFGLWVIGRTRLAVRDFPHVSDNTNPSLVLIISVIEAICKTSPNALSSERLDELLAPLAANGMNGHVRFFRAAYRPPRLVLLTPTEAKVLRAVREGKSSGEIAESLRRSPQTIEGHIKNACRKLGCSGRLAAVHYATELALL